MLLCSWCEDAATVRLVSDSDMRDHAHAACEEHHAMWGRLYRRAVPVGREVVVDLRDGALPPSAGAGERSSPRTVA